jgi:peptidoglycan-associated lipoprotein
MVGSATEATGPAVFFAYDSYEVSSDYNALLDQTAKRLLANKAAKVRLEGNTDERGSAEYNIGLGERRAQAVKHALVVRGVGESQLSTVSYGAERPQVQGHDEQAWAKNRRVDLVDANR